MTGGGPRVPESRSFGRLVLDFKSGAASLPQGGRGELYYSGIANSVSKRGLSQITRRSAKRSVPSVSARALSR